MLQIRWHGHACWEIKNEITLVTDPHDGKSIGIPAPNVHGDIILVSHDHYDHNSVKSVEKEGSKVVLDGRKKTIGDVEIKGVDSFHDEDEGAKRGNNIMYKFSLSGIKFCHLGDLGHDLSDDAIAEIGEVAVPPSLNVSNYRQIPRDVWRDAAIGRTQPAVQLLHR